jgi:hypothetical protein
VLSAAGAALLAGCSGFDSDERDSETIPAGRLRGIVPHGDSEPVVVETLPVEIERTKLAASTRRVTELLAELPMPFGPEDVPNGHIRQELTSAATDATDYVTEARTSGSRLVALDYLRRARSEARYAAAGWAFVEDDLTEAALHADHRELRTDAESFRTEFAYLGDDPVTAALVYGEIEGYLHSVLEYGRRPRHSDSSPLLAVAEWGDHVETAQTHLEDGRYLYDRFRSTLPEETGSVEATLVIATETMTAELQTRRDELPSEPADDDNELRWRLQHELRGDAKSSVEHVTELSGPASSLLAATEGLTNFLAYDRLQTRIGEGAQFGVEDMSDVWNARNQAVDAITTALDESPRPALARPILADAARSVYYADDRLSDYDGDVRLSWLDNQLYWYLIATLRAQSIPAASRLTLDALDR